MVCVAYVPYAVICLLAPAPVLGLLFGAPYDVTAATSLQWLAVVPVIFAGAFLFNVALLAMGRQKVILVSALTALVLGVIGDLILIPLYGPAGAAAATVLGYSAQMVVAAVALRADMGLPPLLPTLVLTLVAGAVLGVTMSVLPLGPALMLGVVLYVGCTFILIRLLAPDRLTEMSMVLPSAVGARLRRWSGRSGPSTDAGERDSND